MKLTRQTYPKVLIAGATILALTSLQAATDVLFENAPDLDNFTVTNSTESGSVVVSSELTTPLSALDGDAIRMFDFDATGRSTLRFTGSSGFTEGLQLSFDAFIDPASTQNVILRLGNDKASMGGIKGSGFSLSISSNGTIVAEVADPENTTWKRVELAGLVTPGTPFNVSMVINTGTVDDLTFPYGDSDVVLAPQTWAIFIDNVLAASDLAGVNPESTGNATYKYVPVDGVWDIWWLTGTATSSEGTDFQMDNVAIYTGVDIMIDPGTTGSDTYAGYAIVDGVLVDTGAWMGWLNIANAPWVYAFDLGKYIYLVEPADSAAGGWAFVGQ